MKPPVPPGGDGRDGDRASEGLGPRPATDAGTPRRALTTRLGTHAGQRHGWLALVLVLLAASAAPAHADGRHRPARRPVARPGVRPAAPPRAAAAPPREIEMAPLEADPDDAPATDADLDADPDATLSDAEFLASIPPPRPRATARPWYRRGQLYLRAGVLHVAPRSRSGELVLSDVGGPASLAVQNGPIAGSRAEMGDATSPAMIIGFARPLGRGELAIETVLAPPVTFELRGAGTVADQSLAPTVLGTVPTGIPALGSSLGRTKALPPVVTVVYRALRGARVRPYVGVGASYLHTYDRQITNPVMTEVAQPRLDIDDAVSAVGQLGLDVHLVGRLYATADVKAMSGFATTARVSNIHMKTPAFPLYESVYVGTVSVDVVVRPVIVTLGAGATF